MPTKRRRHSITETPRVEAALNRLRAQMQTDRLELGDLVVRGAEAKLAELENQGERDAELRRRLADRIREGRINVDPEIAKQARASWIPRDVPPLD